MKYACQEAFDNQETGMATSASDKTSRRRGRLPHGERDQRRNEILDAALATLIDAGLDQMTMLAVAERAGASKGTLYTWFGNRDGLLAALIERNADGSAERIQAALAEELEHREVLTAYASGLLGLLTSPASIVLNRAAMGTPSLADTLLASGRHRIGPLVERYLGELHRAGSLTIPDPSHAFQVLYGLVVRDIQIRVLLGEASPTKSQIRAQADQAVDEFLRLFSNA